MNQLSFEQLPMAVAMLTKEVSELKSLLLKRQENPCDEKQEKILNLKEAAKFLDLAESTIYSKVSRGELPSMKRGNKLYFSQSDLLKYLREGQKRSYNEVDAEAEAYFAKN